MDEVGWMKRFGFGFLDVGVSEPLLPSIERILTTAVTAGEVARQRKGAGPIAVSRIYRMGRDGCQAKALCRRV